MSIISQYSRLTPIKVLHGQLIDEATHRFTCVSAYSLAVWKLTTPACASAASSRYQGVRTTPWTGLEPARHTAVTANGQALLSQQSRQPSYRHPPNEDSQKGVQAGQHWLVGTNNYRRVEYEKPAGQPDGTLNSSRNPAATCHRIPPCPRGLDTLSPLHSSSFNNVYEKSKLPPVLSYNR